MNREILAIVKRVRAGEASAPYELAIALTNAKRLPPRARDALDRAMRAALRRQCVSHADLYERPGVDFSAIHRDFEASVEALVDAVDTTKEQPSIAAE